MAMALIYAGLRPRRLLIHMFLLKEANVSNEWQMLSDYTNFTIILIMMGDIQISK